MEKSIALYIMPQLSSTTRFSDRTDNYEKYRPGYPDEIIPWLEKMTGLQKEACIADIGSGTGIFSALLLKHGYRVKAVEPNGGMRMIAEKNMQMNEHFTSLNGTAEETTLAGNSVDLITAAQAFHWFNVPVVRKEFQRIVTSGGYVLLIWNILQQPTPFLKKYKALKEKYATELKNTVRANPDHIRQFFEPYDVITQQFHHCQLLHGEELQGLLLSSSLVPLEGPDHDLMMKELKQLFEACQENGKVEMIYETQLYLAPISEPRR